MEKVARSVVAAALVVALLQLGGAMALPEGASNPPALPEGGVGSPELSVGELNATWPGKASPAATDDPLQRAAPGANETNAPVGSPTPGPVQDSGALLGERLTGPRLEAFQCTPEGGLSPGPCHGRAWEAGTGLTVTLRAVTGFHADAINGATVRALGFDRTTDGDGEAQLSLVAFAPRCVDLTAALEHETGDAGARERTETICWN